ncbi:MAG: FkbM family methyltransferase [Deltaproteobacteria bacterium]|nr:FkbM family methyltransferase [Deltaproteobacteria bacterium]
MKEAEDPKTEYFAQFGEDRILEGIFRHRSKGVCVEVGANDGILDSMTCRFESMGWTCLLVEPIPDLFRKIAENRKCIAKNYAASSVEGEASFFVAEEAIGMSALELTRTQRKSISRAGGTIKEIRVRKKTLDGILEESGVDAIDFISIDVEGHEMEVLKGFSLEKYRPRIVLIEDNSNQTDPTVQNHMKSKGYELFNRTGVNDWYAAESDGELVSPKQVEAFLEERAKAYLANKIALHFPVFLPFVPDSIKALPKKLIRLLSPGLYRIRWRRKEPGPGKGDVR